MSIIARLGVLLGLNSAEFTKGLDDALKKSKNFERESKRALKEAAQAQQEMITVFGRAAAAAGVLAAAYVSVVKAADGIADAATAFDMTISSLLASRAALQASGNEAENLSSIMQKLASVQQDARDGSDKMREAFAKLGISGKDVENLSLDDLFKRVASELAKMEDATKRNAYAQDLLGKAAKGTDWATFVNEYKKFDDPELERAILENAKAWDNIEKSMTKILEIAQKLVEPISYFINNLPKIGSAFADIEAGKGFDFAAKEQNAPASPINIAKPAQKGGYSTASEKEKAAAEAARKKALSDMQYQMNVQMRLFNEMMKYRKELEALDEIQSKKIDSIHKEYYANSELLKLERKRMDIREDQYENEHLILQQKLRLIDIDKKYNEEESAALIERQRATLEGEERAQEMYEAKIQQINYRRELEISATKEIQKLEAQNLEEQHRRQWDFFAGWNDMRRRSEEENQRIYKLGEQAFTGTMKTMEDAFIKFAETGKLSFKDLTKSIMSDLLRIAIRMQVIGIFTNMFGIMSSNATVSPGAVSPDLGTSWKGMGIGGAASGGFIDSPTLVGENGPELFIPKTPGTVIPNGSWEQMSGNRGGMTINGPYIANMSTIDSKSFEQRIYESSKAVWAAGKYAEKSLAVSGGRS